MKKIYKHILTACLSLFLLTYPAERCNVAEASGLPTIDVANLVQNILGYFDQLDQIMMDEESFKNLREKIEQYKHYVELFSTAAVGFSVVNDVKDAAIFIFDEAQYIYDVTQYFYSIGARPSVCLAAAGFLKDFNKLSGEITSDFNKFFDILKNNKSSIDVSFLMQLDSFVNEYRFKLSSLSMHYRSELSRLYQTEMFYRQAVSNRNFRKNVIY